MTPKQFHLYSIAKGDFKTMEGAFIDDPEDCLALLSHEFSISRKSRAKFAKKLIEPFIEYAVTKHSKNAIGYLDDIINCTSDTKPYFSEINEINKGVGCNKEDTPYKQCKDAICSDLIYIVVNTIRDNGPNFVEYVKSSLVDIALNVINLKYSKELTILKAECLLNSAGKAVFQRESAKKLNEFKEKIHKEREEFAEMHGKRVAPILIEVFKDEILELTSDTEVEQPLIMRIDLMSKSLDKDIETIISKVRVKFNDAKFYVSTNQGSWKPLK